MKKLLALVLALVMTMSLVTISNAAYSDAADIDYKEAVDVMSAIGVLQGSDGKFNPDGILTRAEACTIIAKMFGMADYAGTTNFVDAKGHWGEGAISFCAGEGIVNGTSATTFDPNGKLTGYAFGKMLLVALGYSADIEGMTGMDWQIKTAKLIKNVELNKGVSGFIGSAELSRQAAAQMALNALQAYEVTYSKDQTVSNNGGSSISTNMTARAVVDLEGNRVTLMKDFFPKLTKKSVADDKGETETVWSLGTTKIGTYGANKPIITYTASTKDSVIAADLSGYTFTNGTLYVDGAATAKSPLAITDINGNDGDGVSVQVYANSSKQINKVVVLHTYLYEVTAKNTIGGTMTLTERTDGVNAADTISLTDASSDKNADFYKDLYAMSKGDFVMLNVANEGSKDTILANLGAPETATGKYTKNETKDGVTSYTVGGTVYKISGAAADRAGLAAAANNANTKVFLDKYGYVLYTKTVTGTSNYAYVLDTQIKTNYDEKTFEYKLLFADGTVEWIKAVSYGKKFDSDAKTALTNIAAKTFVTYTKLDNGYDLNNNVVGVSANGKSVAKNTVAFDGKVMTRDSVLLTEQANGSYTVYTGVTQMPNYTITTGKYILDGSSVVMIVSEKQNTASKDVLYFAADLTTANANSVDYVDNAPVYTFKAFLNGSMQDIKVAHSYFMAVDGDPDDALDVPNDKIAAGLYIGAAANSDGAYTAMTAETISEETSISADVTVTDEGVYGYTLDSGDTIQNNGTSLGITDTTNTKAASFIVSSDFEGYDVVSSALASYEFGSSTLKTTLTSAATIYVHVNADGQADWAIATSTLPVAA